MTKLLQTHVDEELYIEFRKKLIEENKTIKEVMVKLIEEYLEDDKEEVIKW